MFLRQLICVPRAHRQARAHKQGGATENGIENMGIRGLGFVVLSLGNRPLFHVFWRHSTKVEWSIFDRIFLIFNITPRGEY